MKLKSMISAERTRPEVKWSVWAACQSLSGNAECGLCQNDKYDWRRPADRII